MDPRLPAPVGVDLISSRLLPLLFPSLHSILQALPPPPLLSSLHSYLFSYGSKRVITEIQTHPTKDHRGIKPAVQFSAGVPMLSTRRRETLNFARVFLYWRIHETLHLTNQS